MFMTFANLASYFEKLEATSKRLELVDILSKLFKESNAEEIGKICYLIQGRVAPFFQAVEMGMAESTIAQAVARAYGPTLPRLRGVKNPKDEVIKLYRAKGNFGLAAKELATKAKPAKGEARLKGRRLTTKALSVSEVFGELRTIAEFSGEGTVEKKVSTLAALLTKLDPTSVKHVVNIPLGTLRLGIGDPTVMDALSLAKKGDKSLRSVLENAYNKTSDLGHVAETFFKKGISGIKNIKLVVGKPIRPALAERLPSAEEAVKRLCQEFAAEPKFDGFRVAVHKENSDIKLFSRNLEDTTHAFPDLVKGVVDEVRAKSAILEGEAIAYNPVTSEFLPFQETTKRRRKYKIEEMAKKLPLVLFAFDLLYLNAKEIAEFFNEAISEGLEGLMLKKLDSAYVAGGRGFHWIKFKRSQAGSLTDTLDCVLLGVYSGKGKRTEFGVGGLLVGVYDEKKDEFVSISRIGTGLTDEEFRKVNEISKH